MVLGSGEACRGGLVVFVTGKHTHVVATEHVVPVQELLESKVGSTAMSHMSDTFHAGILAIVWVYDLTAARFKHVHVVV